MSRGIWQAPPRVGPNLSHPGKNGPDACRSLRLSLGCDLLGFRQADRHELADAALGHGDAEQAIHARHCDRIMGDSDETGIGLLPHLLEQVAEALDIVIVERRVDLVQHADRRWIGQEDRENQRHRGQRLLAAGKQGHRGRLLAWRPRHDLKTGFKRVVALDQLQLGRAAAEE